MLVRIEFDRIGSLMLRPVSSAWSRKITRHLRDVGAPYTGADVYVQSDVDVESILETLTRDARGWLDRGWDVRVRMSDADYLYLVGWDAQLLA